MIDMASTSPSAFTLLIPPYNKAMTGSDQVVTPSKNPLYNLRPNIFFDSMLIKGVQPEELVSLTQSSRTIQPETRKHDAIEEPDYDLTMLRKTAGNVEQTMRVVHFSRVTLLPYQQDIYDDRGKVVTQVMYNAYQRFGEIQFPTDIEITRPIDEYALKITVTKLTPNEAMEADQFDLPVPDGYTVQKMD
jgi:hypothetical protein